MISQRMNMHVSLKKMMIERNCDSDYAGEKDTRKIVASYAIYFFENLIIWKSKVKDQ